MIMPGTSRLGARHFCAYTAGGGAIQAKRFPAITFATLNFH